MKLEKNTKSCLLPPPSYGWVESVNIHDDGKGQKYHSAEILENWVIEDQVLKIRPGYKLYHDIGQQILGICEHQTDQENSLLVVTSKGIYQYKSSYGVTLIYEFDEVVPSTALWRAQSFRKASVLYNGHNTPLFFQNNDIKRLSLKNLEYHSQINGIKAYQGRLFFWLRDSLTFYYGNLHEVEGEVHAFDLSDLGGFTGKIVAIESLSLSASSGLSEVMVIFLSSGQVLFYAGIDPSISEKWQLVSQIQIAQPMSADAILSVGRDLILMTEQGYISLAEVLGQQSHYISTKFSQAAFKELTQILTNNRHEIGFGIFHYPEKKWIIFNLPSSKDEQGNKKMVQHVFNYAQHHWYKFTNIDAMRWIEFESKIYFTSGSKLYEFNQGSKDDQSEIKAIYQTACLDFGAVQRLKIFSMIKPHLVCEDDTRIEIEALGFNITEDIFAPKKSKGLHVVKLEPVKKEQSVWGAPWLSATWQVKKSRYMQWLNFQMPAYKMALRIVVSSKQPVYYFGSELMYHS